MVRIVVADALVLEHQAIKTHKTDLTAIVLHTRFEDTWDLKTVLKKNDQVLW